MGALHSSGTSLSLLKDTVSKQQSPKLNKQSQSYESLPDGLTLPTSTFFKTQILPVKGFIQQPQLETTTSPIK